MNAPGYEQLAAVLQAAFAQAAEGKGAERHANDLPFHEQRMQGISELLDTDGGMAYQACKKVAEARGMAHDARERELLGAIVYIAGMVIFHRQRNGATFGSILQSMAGRDFEPAQEIDDENPRNLPIHQGGELAEHVYPAVDAAKEPERPRHQCSSCGLGHATHECTGGLDELPLTELAIQQGGKAIEETPAPVKPVIQKPELPPTDHLVDPTGKPSWDHAPIWANYLTQNKRGAWTFWQYKPSIVGDWWSKGKGCMQEFNSGELAGRWQDSLEAAPGLTVGKQA